MYTTGAPSKGTRIRPDLRRRCKPIDLGVSTSCDLTMSQSVKRGLLISDHLPVEVKLNLTYLREPFKAIIKLDRKMLADPKGVKAICSHNYDIDSLGPKDGVTKFHNELESLLKRLSHMMENLSYQKQSKGLASISEL